MSPKSLSRRWFNRANPGNPLETTDNHAVFIDSDARESSASLAHEPSATPNWADWGATFDGAASDRQHARVVPIKTIFVRARNKSADLFLWDLSRAGFSVLCAQPFLIGIIQRFTFSTRHGLSVTLVGQAVHSRATTASGELMFVTGWEFLTIASADAEPAIRLLVTAATDPHFC